MLVQRWEVDISVYDRQREHPLHDKTFVVASCGCYERYDPSFN